MAIKDLVLIWDKLVTTIEKATVDNPLLKHKLGQNTIELVEKRTRKGFGVSISGQGTKKKVPLKELENGYKRERRYLQRRGSLSAKTTANKSNFTKSGQAMDNLTFDVIPSGVNVKPRPEDKKKFKNQDKREFQVLDLTKEETDKLTRDVAAAIVKAFRNFKV